MSEHRRQHPLMIVQVSLRGLLQLIWLVLVPVIFASSDTGDLLIPALALAALLLLTFVRGLLSWLFFSYRLDERGLHIRSGIVFKQERSICPERVQSINIFTNILQRPLRVSMLQLKTAGSSSDVEFTLHSVSWGEAERIQLALGGEARCPVPAEGPEPGGFGIPPREMLIAGLSSGRFLILFSLLLAAYSQVMQYIPPEWMEAMIAELEATPLQMIAVVGLLLTLLSWMISTLHFYVQYHGFRVRREGDSLHIAWGLLEERRATLGLERVQAVSIRESPPFQLLGRCSLHMELAGGGDRDKGQMKLLCPILPIAEAEAFLAEMLPAYALPSAFSPLPRRSRRRYMLRASLLPVALLLSLSLLTEAYLCALPLLPIALALGWLRHRDSGISVSEGQLCLRTRLYSRSTTLLRRSRVQSMELSAHPMQRLASLRHVSVAVLSSPAGVRFRLKDVDKADSDAAWRWFRRSPGPGGAPEGPCEPIPLGQSL